MAPRDRTAEFHSALSSIRARTAVPARAAKNGRVTAAHGDGAAAPLRGAGGAPAAGSSKSEFGRLAGNIARDINSTTVKLQKLAQRECGFEPGGECPAEE
jgi:syntaxin 5